MLPPAACSCSLQAHRGPSIRIHGECVHGLAGRQRHIPLLQDDADAPRRAQAIGELTPAAAAALGLPAGLLVAPGSGDNQMSALGAGAVAQGAFVASLGTSGTLFGASRAPVVDPSGSIAPFCDATGQWLPLLCTMNCTLVPEEARAPATPNF